MKKWGLIVIFFLLAVGIGSAQIVFTTGDTLDQSLSISSGKGEPALGAQEILDISTCLELKDISEDLSGDYQLVNDIDCSDTVNWNSGAGFDPLGDGTTQFNGTFDGQNYNISDLFINRSQEYVGLFGRIDTTGEIKDVGLSNFTVQGGSRWTGTLAGHGVNAKFTGIWATGTVIGTTQETGGMIGALTNNAEFNRSWTNVTVIGGNNSGGFAGNLISAELNDVFSHGNIEGDRNVGGLVGFSFGGTIAKSYSTATLSGNSNVGGIIGSFTSATASNSFWDENSSGISTSPLGTGKSTVEMQNVSTFTDTATTGLTAAWDFVGDPNDDVATEDIWEINSSRNGGYPYLQQFENLYSVDTNANGESCTVNGECTSGYCADSFYNGSDQADLCCSTNSCVAGGTCHADLATYGASTCYDGVWIADGGQFIVRNEAGTKQFVVDKWGSAVLSGERNASCTTGAPNDSFLIDMVGGQDTWINASGFMCDSSASINTRTTPLASLGGTDHFSIVNATRDIVFQRWGVGGSPLHMLGDFADQVGTIS